MIVRPRPNIIQLFFVMRGSIVPRIVPHMIGFALWASLIVAAAKALPFNPGSYGLAPFALVGVALSLYLGFRNNAAYDRWWEARTLWGRLIYEIRNFSRAALSVIPPESGEARAMLMELLAFCHFLRGSLRNVDVTDQAREFIGDEADAARAAVNAPDALVRRIGARLAELKRAGAIGEIDFRILDERLSGVAAVQAGCERISTTPLPFAYTLLLQRSAYVFCILLPFALAATAGWATPLFTALIAYCFFGLDSLSQELEDPFGPEANDLALDAMCRVCEISVREALGEPAPPMPEADHFYYS